MGADGPQTIYRQIREVGGRREKRTRLAGDYSPEAWSKWVACDGTEVDQERTAIGNIIINMPYKGE